jgi:hypothetical protein
MSDVKKELFDEQEFNVIFAAACSPAGGANEDQIFAVLKWCEETRVRNLMLETILHGIVVVKSYEGLEPMWGMAEERAQ